MEKQIQLAVIAAGGAGINILSKLVKEDLGNVHAPSYVAVDTSSSNMSKLPPDEQSVVTMILGDSGAGKNRAALLREIQSKIDHSGIYEHLQDINVIIFSMSGGSGSVIGPMLVREATMSGKAVIAVGIVDACSKLDCLNSINTIRSLDHIAKTDKVYIPTMFYSNINNGRFAVNNAVVNRVHQVITLFLHKSIEELDYTDRMNFLRPDKVGLAPVGIYGFAVTDRSQQDTFHTDTAHLYKERGITTVEQPKTCQGEDYIIVSRSTCLHSGLVINATGSTTEMITNATYLGLSEEIDYLAVCGAPISEDLIKVLNTKADRFEKAMPVTAGDISAQFVAKGDLDQSGIIH